ncbi:hypothetical protein J132_02155 [Termitomyces sp. J132]|nr:hypothetical protein J132_02155 [Termitomyces sp. J132]
MRHANNCWGDELAIDKGGLVYLSTKNLNLPKGQASKLSPKWVGPYKVLEAEPSMSNYVLELLTALQAQRIIPKFHVLLLRPYSASNNALFPNCTTPEPYDFGTANDQEWFVDDLIGHRWTQSGDLKFEVCWSLGDTTWEPLANCKLLAVMDHYLELQGVKRPRHLSQCALRANRAAAYKFSSGNAADMPQTMVYKFAHRGFPCTLYELERLFRYCVNLNVPCRDRIVAFMLISELQLVAQHLDTALQDRTMQILLQDPSYWDLPNPIQGPKDMAIVER